MGIKKFLCLLIPELSNKYFLFIGFLIGSLFRKSIPGILSDYAFDLNKDKKDFAKEKQEKFFDIVCNILSDLLTGVIHYILIKSDYNNYRKNNNYNNDINDNIEINDNNEIINKKKRNRISLIFNDETSKTKLLYQIIFMISAIDFICQLCFYFGCHANKNIIKNKGISHPIDYLYSFLVIDIVARYIFSRLILKIYFNYHHYLSFILNIIVLLILFIIDLNCKIKNDRNERNYSVLFLIIFLLQYILYSLEDIINKVALIKLFIYPESLLFYKGIFSLAYFFVFVIFIFFLGDLELEINFDFKLLYKIIVRIVFILTNIVRSIYLVKVIDIFTSQHISFLKVLETIILFVYYYFDRLIKEKNEAKYKYAPKYFKNDSVIDLIEINAFLILLFSALIHNEIIIINCTKLKRSTKYFLSIEAELEKYGLLSKNTEISNID